MNNIPEGPEDEEILTAMPNITHWRYWNANGFGTAIVAVLGGANDWAAYIGAQPDPSSEQETVEWVSRHGCKLGESEARAFFHMDETLVYRP